MFFIFSNPITASIAPRQDIFLKMKALEAKAYLSLVTAILLLVFGVLTCQAAAKADEKKTPIAVEVLLIISAVMFMSSCLATCLTVITGCSENNKERTVSACTGRAVLLYIGYSIFLCIVYAGLQDGSIKSGWYDKPVERVFITFIILSFIGLCLCCTPSVNADTNTGLHKLQEVVIETALPKEASQTAPQTASTTSQLRIVTSPIQDGSKTTTI